MFIATSNALLRLVGSHTSPLAGGRCPQHRKWPRFPLEPPSLACPTPQGRAMAAEGERASLWWAGASLRREAYVPSPQRAQDGLHGRVSDLGSPSVDTG
jgi:hypothetical protein